LSPGAPVSAALQIGSLRHDGLRQQAVIVAAD